MVFHKSTDRGKTWTEISTGLPGDHMGRIGLAGAPSDPDMVYAIIEASDKEKASIGQRISAALGRNGLRT